MVRKISGEDGMDSNKHEGNEEASLTQSSYAHFL